MFPWFNALFYPDLLLRVKNKCWQLQLCTTDYKSRLIRNVPLVFTSWLSTTWKWMGEKIKNNVTTPKHLQCQTPSFSKKLPLCTRLKRKGQHASKICFHCSWARHIYLMFCFIRSERGEILLILAWTLITLLQKSDALSA